MDLDLAHQLLLGSTLLKGCFGDDLGRVNLLSVAFYELVALGKASFAEEPAFDVLPVADLAIGMLDLLLDNGRAAGLLREEDGLALRLGY